MKLLTLFGLAGTLLSYSTTAQEAAKQTSASKFSIGLYGSVSQTVSGYQRSLYIEPEKGLKNIGGGVFIRYFLNEHFALESSATISVSKPKYREAHFDYFETPPLDHFEAPPYTEIHGTARGISYNVPLQMQYHFLKANAKLRPYFGMGFGVLNRRYDIYRTVEYHNNGELEVIHSQSGDMMYYAQAAQGFTYRVCDKLQINQSLYYQFDVFDPEQQNIGLNIGVGYLF